MNDRARAIELLSFPFRSLREFELMRAGALLVVGLLSIGLGFYRGQVLVPLLMGVCAFGGAAYFFRQAQLQHAHRASRAVRTIASSGDDIVWVYEVSVVSARSGSHQAADVYFCFADGGHDVITVPAAHRNEAFAVLERLFPRATFGFSDQRAAEFSSSPASLRRAAPAP